MNRAHDWWSTPGPLTDIGDADVAVSDVASAVAVVQGLLVYDTVAEGLYGVTLTEAQLEAIHERRADTLLHLAQQIDTRPLAQPRDPAQRIGGRCHQFARLTVALLRSAGIPARSRCGFGRWFRDGWFEDHWIAEVWSEREQRWKLVDAQIDSVWAELAGYTGDHLDQSSDDFLNAGQVWQRWRAGEIDGDRCGLSAIDEHGAFWIAANLRLDLAALNKIEMLPWDIWGLGWEPGETPDDSVLAQFDAVAELTIEPDADLDALRAIYEQTDGLRMPGTVFNIARGAAEAVDV